MTKLMRLLLMFLSLVLFSCYPTEERHNLGKEDLANGRRVKVPTKIHLVNGSLILCNNGFAVQHDTIRASGLSYSFSRLDSADYMTWLIPLDSVAALEYFDRGVKGSRVVGSFLLTATTNAEIALASVAIIKAIFGSCPTVYSFNNGNEHLEAECFSYSIGRKLEMTDLDRLSSQDVSGNQLTLRVKNEALETHYIDEFSLCYVDHPAGIEIFPTDEGKIIATRNFVSAFSALNSEGKNISNSICDRDTISYTSDSASVSRMFAEKRKDWIDCVIPSPRNAATLTVAMRAKNSLENTTLLYDVMMRNQGLNVLEWSKDLNDNLWYAWKLSRWYKEFSGIEIFVYEDDEYVSKGRFFDTGPIAWRQTATQVSIDSQEDSVRIRFSFFPDNWTIDWIGFDFSDNQKLSLIDAICFDAKDNRGSTRKDAIRKIQNDDEDYLVTYPGEWVDLNFTVPSFQDSQRTFFVRSKGYYVEWVRPEWVRERPNIPGFDLSQREEISQRLSELWLSKKNRFEDQFYHDRIPSWDLGERR